MEKLFLSNLVFAPAEASLVGQVRSLNLNLWSSAEAVCPVVERAMPLRALIVLRHIAAMLVTPLLRAPPLVRIPVFMLMLLPAVIDF